MIDFNAFSDELVKIAVEGFKPLSAGHAGVEVKAELPILEKLPRKPEAAKKRIIEVLGDNNVPAVLGYRNIVIPEEQMPNMKSMGFKPTHLATPLPGEKPFAVSYRAGRLHAHKIGPVYLVHQDKHAPMGKGGSYLSLKAVQHGFQEGIPSIIRRARERGSLVTGVGL